MATTLVSLNRFFDLPELAAGKRELIQGEVRELPPPKARHSKVANRIAEALRVYANTNWQDTDRILMESGYEYTREPASWIMPDVAVNHPDQTVDETGYFQLSPMIAVEVISPSNTARDVKRKIRIYLENGCEEVWVVYPETSTVSIEKADSRRESLPGFRLDLDAIFRP